MHRKILMYHAVLQIVSSIRQKSVMQSILVSRAVMHVTAGIQNVQVSAVIHKTDLHGKPEICIGKSPVFLMVDIKSDTERTENVQKFLTCISIRWDV